LVGRETWPAKSVTRTVILNRMGNRVLSLGLAVGSFGTIVGVKGRLLTSNMIMVILRTPSNSIDSIRRGDEMKSTRIDRIFNTTPH
jgi:cysteine synthase